MSSFLLIYLHFCISHLYHLHRYISSLLKQDKRLWISDKGNGNETDSLFGDLSNSKYDQRGPFGFQSVVYTVPNRYLSNSIGAGYSRKIEITYPTDISTRSGLDCARRSSCKHYDLAQPLEYNNGGKLRHTNTKFPIVVFAYGGDETNDGRYGCFNHRTIMNHIASHGFIVCW